MPVFFCFHLVCIIRRDGSPLQCGDTELHVPRLDKQTGLALVIRQMGGRRREVGKGFTEAAIAISTLLVITWSGTAGETGVLPF